MRSIRICNPVVVWMPAYPQEEACHAQVSELAQLQVRGLPSSSTLVASRCRLVDERLLAVNLDVAQLTAVPARQNLFSRFPTLFVPCPSRIQ
jgi:hypothetical protein